MHVSFKLYFKYLLFHSNQTFFKYLIRSDKNVCFFLPKKQLYFLTLHLKLSSLFYSTQLSDIFAYELPLSLNPVVAECLPINPSLTKQLLIYNFHSMLNQQRFFIFVMNSPTYLIINPQPLMTISELFSNANWLEREVAELHGVFFSGKKDLRNLLLQYGDTSAPMQKSFPSVGTREIFYDSVTDLLIQAPVSLQF